MTGRLRSWTQIVGGSGPHSSTITLYVAVGESPGGRVEARSSPPREWDEIGDRLVLGMLNAHVRRGEEIPAGTFDKIAEQVWAAVQATVPCWEGRDPEWRSHR